MVCGLDSHFWKYVLPLVVLDFVFWYDAFTSDVRIEQTYPGFDYENPVDPKMKDYKPFCDFAPWATCSKVLMSPPGRFLRYFGIAKQGGMGGQGLIDYVRGLIDVPNPTLGVAYFMAHLFWPVILILPIPFFRNFSFLHVSS